MLVQHTIQTKLSELVCEMTCPLLPPHVGSHRTGSMGMLDLRVIEQSSSDWHSPIVLVPKPEGTCRFCIDFWRINVISMFDPYSMPWVGELLDHLGEAQYIMTLDLTKGY